MELITDNYYYLITTNKQIKYSNIRECQKYIQCATNTMCLNKGKFFY